MRVKQKVRRALGLLHQGEGGRLGRRTVRAEAKGHAALCCGHRAGPPASCDGVPSEQVGPACSQLAHSCRVPCEQGEAGEGAVLVYQRLTGDSEDDEEEEAAAAPKQPAGGFFAAFAPPSPKEGTATIAEREVRRLFPRSHPPHTWHLTPVTRDSTVVAMAAAKTRTLCAPAAPRRRATAAPAESGACASVLSLLPSPAVVGAQVMRKLAAAKGAPAAPRLPANLPSSPATVKTAARGGTVKVAPPAPRSPSPPPRAAPAAPRVDPKAAAEAQRRGAFLLVTPLSSAGKAGERPPARLPALGSA